MRSNFARFLMVFCFGAFSLRGAAPYHEVLPEDREMANTVLLLIGGGLNPDGAWALAELPDVLRRFMPLPDGTDEEAVAYFLQAAAAHYAAHPPEGLNQQAEINLEWIDRWHNMYICAARCRRTGPGVDRLVRSVVGVIGIGAWGGERLIKKAVRLLIYNPIPATILAVETGVSVAGYYELINHEAPYAMAAVLSMYWLLIVVFRQA